MSSKGKWENFFVEAGISQRQAADYASTFSNNRMRLDMMDELNKELLRDLGIKALGDIITILRHAKNKTDNRSPSPEITMLSHAKVSSVVPAKASSTITKPPNMVQNAKSRPPVVKTLQPTRQPTVAATVNKPIAVPTNKTGVTGVKFGPHINKLAAPSNQISLGNKTVNASNKDSKSGIGKPRMKLSDRFDGFEVESKKMKIDDNNLRKDTHGESSSPIIKCILPKSMGIVNHGESSSPSVKCILPKTMGIVNHGESSSPSVKCILPKTGMRSINIDEKFRTRLAPESSKNISIRDDKKNVTRPTIVTALNKTSPAAAKSVQFTVQVPSNFPKEKSEQTLSTKTKPSSIQTKVTVVPAKGKALNRDKQMTSIFDRLDAPPSSSVAAELLKDEPGHTNVFRRLGSKSEKPKTNNDNAKNPADNKQAADSVFRRLGTHNL